MKLAYKNTSQANFDHIIQIFIEARQMIFQTLIDLQDISRHTPVSLYSNYNRTSICLNYLYSKYFNIANNRKHQQHMQRDKQKNIASTVLVSYCVFKTCLRCWTNCWAYCRHSLSTHDCMFTDILLYGNFERLDILQVFPCHANSVVVDWSIY